MTSILRCLTILCLSCLFALPPAWGEERGAVATPAIYSKPGAAEIARPVSWPGYYYYGVYYGSYRWRYQPYYTYYASPWFSGYTPAVVGYPAFSGDIYGTPYVLNWPDYGGWPGYGWPGYAAGPGDFGPYWYTWPHSGAYGYTYYGPVTYGY